MLLRCVAPLSTSEGKQRMAVASTLSSEDSDLLLRYHRYHEWCESYKIHALPEAAVAFRLRVPTLRIRGGPSFRPDALLPILQMLRHDSCIHTLDLSGLPLCDSGAYVVADGLAAGAPLREVLLEGCGVGAAGPKALCARLSRRRCRLRSAARNSAAAPAASGALAQLRTLCV